MRSTPGGPDPADVVVSVSLAVLRCQGVLAFIYMGFLDVDD
jgi:hypothetical protein